MLTGQILLQLIVILLVVQMFGFLCRRIGQQWVIGEILAGPLRQVAPGSPRHLALVEAVRRLYRQAAMDADRADKQAALARTRSS